uniref:Uncharacterized protein n=1 Tax=Cannabis sativa TaxID=3483 RepID=A0A803P6X2_CANSA
MLEESRKKISGELGRLPNHEGGALRVPRDNLIGGGIFYQHREHWSKPEVNLIKINVDKTILAEAGAYGASVLAQDSNALLILWYILVY